LKVQAKEKMAKFLEIIIMNIKQRWDEMKEMLNFVPLHNFLYQDTNSFY
jgi:hypothetical protein